MTLPSTDAGRSTLELPYLTADLPGVGGRMRECREDFLVEELPRYRPSGAGDHTYFAIRKTGLTTHEAVARVAAALGRRPRDVGCAGLKDARAVTVQTLSLEHCAPSRIEALRLEGIEVLWTSRHRNKLRLGHLAGNRFTVRLRSVGPGAADRAKAILETLTRQGVPNAFGPQRFGFKGDNDGIGAALVHGDSAGALAVFLGRPAARETPAVRTARELYEAGDLAGALASWPYRFQVERRALERLVAGGPPAHVLRSLPKTLRTLFVHAYQSRLFNRLLACRLEAGTLGHLEEGDLAFLHDRGAVFTVTDPAREQPRAGRLEISPSGPLFGRKSTLAGGAPGRRERALLEAVGLCLEDFRRPEALGVRGARRPFRVPLDGASATPDGEDLVLTFSLPAGGYATRVLAEVMKTSAPED